VRSVALEVTPACLHLSSRAANISHQQDIFQSYVVSGFSRTVAGPPEGGHYERMEVRHAWHPAASDFPELRRVFAGYLHQAFPEQHGTPSAALLRAAADPVLSSPP
jgi:hypothetical protein